MPHNLFSQVAHGAAADAVFISTDDGRTITYGEAFLHSARYANVLRDQGARFGDRIAVQVEKSPEALILYLACLRIGAAFLPLNTAYTLAELDYFISDATPRVMVCAPEKHDGIATLAGRHGVAATLTLDAQADGSLPQFAKAARDEFETAAVEPDDLAAILYTSGTTGRSKGAMLTHANLASNALTLVDSWRFTRTDVLLHALPIFHTHGLFVATNVVLFSQGSMIFLPRFDSEAVRRHLPRSTAMMGVPTFYTRLIKEAWLDQDTTRHIRLFISGSAPLLADTHRQWTSRTGHRILERYGMTETNMITSNPYDGDRIAGSVGPPLPGVQVRIADIETGAVLGAGDVGVIEVKGPNVFKGYWRMPEKTRAEFRDDGYFITGDIGVVDANGYVSIVGRGKDLIITGGYNVYPKEIEVEIDAMEGVEESAVIGLPHADFGEAVTAIVIVRPGAAVTEAAVLGSLQQKLARYKLPKRILFEAALPRNTMGKVIKGEIRKKFADLYE